MFPFEILSYAGVLGSLSQRDIADDFCSLLKYLMLPFPIPAFPFDLCPAGTRAGQDLPRHFRIQWGSSVGKGVRAQFLGGKMLCLAQEDFKLQVLGNWRVSFRACHVPVVIPKGWGCCCCLRVSPALLQLPFVLSRNKKCEPSQLTLGADSKLPWGMFHSLFFFPHPDQIDENLKLALQQDLTTMAPGLIIQVIRI